MKFLNDSASFLLEKLKNHVILTKNLNICPKIPKITQKSRKIPKNPWISMDFHCGATVEPLAQGGCISPSLGDSLERPGDPFRSGPGPAFGLRVWDRARVRTTARDFTD